MLFSHKLTDVIVNFAKSPSPGSVIGAHLNMVVANTPSSNLKYFLAANLPSGWVIDKEDEAMILPFGGVFSDLMLESGYMHIQATKPDTVGAEDSSRINCRQISTL